MRTAIRRPAMSMPLFIATLLVLSMGLFALAVVVERSTGDDHASSALAGPVENTEPGHEGGESSEAGEVGRPNAAPAETPERLFGVPAESPVTVIAMVFASLLLAAVVLRYRRRPVFIVVAVFALGAAALDSAEVVRQFGADRFGIGMLALVVAALHVAVLAAAVALIRRPVQV